MIRKKKRRILAGLLAITILCGTFLSESGMVLAADTTVETEETVGTEADTKDNMEAQTESETEHLVTAEDITILQGDPFDIEKDITGIHAEEEDKVTLKEAKDDAGNVFCTDVPGTYHCVYQVVPVRGDSYEVSRKIMVKVRETETRTEDGGSDSGQDEGDESDDGEGDPAESDLAVEGDVELAAFGVEEGVLFSVVPAYMSARAGGNVSLVRGADIYYPADLGNYSTCYFYVNGKIAYCIQSHLETPPDSDYVANVYESNTNLQKVLYYGYGGPGDVSASFLSGYSDDQRYLLTHLAASYAYAGDAGAFTGCTEAGLQQYRVRDYINYLFGLEAPPSAAISLSSSGEKAYMDGEQQKTGNITLSGDHRNYVTLTLPAGVTYHDQAGTEKTGGTVRIYGGTTFYFTAPKTMTGTWRSGTLSGQLGAQWKTLVVSTVAGSQDIGYGDFYDEGNGTVSFTVTWMDLAKVKVVKEDAASGVKLAGAVFGIYSDAGCTQMIAKMSATDRQGVSEAEIVKNQDTVYLKEITAPAGYRINTRAYNVKLVSGETQEVTVANEEQKGKITIRKTGGALTGVTGEAGSLSFQYSDQAFQEAKYAVYAAEEISSQDGQTKIYSAGELVEEMETKTDGSITSGLLPLGTYKVVEQKAPENLTIGKTEGERIHVVKLSYAGQTAEIAQSETSYKNERPQVEVSAVKRSENDGAALQGATFGLYATEDITGQDGNVLVKGGTLIETAISDQEGKAAFHADIPIGFHYSIREIQAPESYYMSDQEQGFHYIYTDDTTYTYTFTKEFLNKEVRGEIHVKKIDKDTQGSIPQGDAQLNGAVYGLYAAEDISHPNQKDGVVYKTDELVAQGTIENATLDFQDLYLGNYYIQEISAPEGYLLDEARYPVELAYEGQEVEIVHQDMTVSEIVKKQSFQLIKIDEDGEQTETNLVKGVGFKIYLISSLTGIQDGSLKPKEGVSFTAEDFIGYDYGKEETASYYADGEKIQTGELFTDEKGYLRSPELPFGDYVVFESTTPENLNTIHPFLVRITEDSREPQAWRVFDDRPFQFFFKIKKKDEQTNADVLENGASYQIYDVKNEEYVTMEIRYPKQETVDTFQTNEEGYLQTPEKLRAGTYRIEEVEAPDVYVQNGYENVLVKDGENIPLNEAAMGGTYEDAARSAVTVNVDSNTAHEVEDDAGEYIVVVNQENDEAVGSLTLTKTGERIAGASKVEDHLLTKLKNRAVSAVNQVADAILGEELFEKEAGYEFQYETGTIEGAGFSVYARETIYTPDGQKDEDGNRMIRYEKDALVAELVTDAEGKAVLNNLPVGSYYLQEMKAGFNCVLNPEKKEFEISYQGQEVAVDYVNLDVVNERQKIRVEILKKSSVTGESLEGAAFGLYAQEDILNAAGEVLVPSGEMIRSAKSNEEGKVLFDVDLPHGKYEVRELEPLPGYLPNAEIYPVDASYTDQELAEIFVEMEVENQPTITEFTKTDLTGGQEVEGAKLQIIKDGKVLEEWISVKEPHIVYALEPGDYVLHEEEAPTADGYVRAEDVEFTVEETGEVQRVEMKDDHTRVSVSKVDITDEKEIEGAKIQILDKDGKIVEEWISGKEPHVIEYLPVGDYILHEEAAPEGYVVVSDVEFAVEETGEIQKVQMKDERPMGRLCVNKTDAENGAALQGVEFEIRNKVTGEMVGTLVTDKDGRAESELLPIAVYEGGKMIEPILYVLEETKPLDGYEKYGKEEEVVFEYQDDQTSVIEVLKEIQNMRKPEVTPKKPAPKTGDMVRIWIPIVLAVLSTVGVIVVVVWKKRR